MPSDAGQNPAKQKPQAIQPPRGTRDFYPIEMARRRWLEAKWRRTAVRHGFDEIDGPTFEHLDLYTVKSGDGIVSELFSFTRAGGETPFALRPEFTPTLARMVAAKANALPKPIKWFSIGPYFRAERPQRGRLREFLQWNVDVLGDPSPEADAEAIACCISMLIAVGLSHRDVKLRISNRYLLQALLSGVGVPPSSHEAALRLLDRRAKSEKVEFETAALGIGIDKGMFAALDKGAEELSAPIADYAREAVAWRAILRRADPTSLDHFGAMSRMINDLEIEHWCDVDFSIVRGLAYYTGTVFEVHETTGAERAIAGGGRYDNLVELFGGPPTPAVGFAMGDVVISLVLQDKGLMPKDDEIARDLGLAPDAFVFAANDEADQAALRPLLAHLRREGLHARRSYKSTRNVGKLLQDADKSGARFAVILESATAARIKDMGSAERSDGEAISASDPADLARQIDARIRGARRAE